MQPRNQDVAQTVSLHARALQVILAVLLYVLLGNARSIQPNPFIPGAIVAVNMTVPILAGILFGRVPGLLVGLLGTLLNALSPAGSIFEVLSIVPHGIMGFIAGYFRETAPTPIVACSLIVGHVLNLTMYVLFGALPAADLLGSNVWYGLAYETFGGVVAVTTMAGIYRLGFKAGRG
jgi:uncharacterized membrane protein